MRSLCPRCGQEHDGDFYGICQPCRREVCDKANAQVAWRNFLWWVTNK